MGLSNNLSDSEPRYGSVNSFRIGEKNGMVTCRALCKTHVDFLTLFSAAWPAKNWMNSVEASVSMEQASQSRALMYLGQAAEFFHNTSLLKSEKH